MKQVQSALTLKDGTELRPNGHGFEVIRQVLADVTEHYVARLSTAVARPTPPRPERAARALAAHLLDLGFSATFLHRWTTRLTRYDPRALTIADIFAEANVLARQPEPTFRMMVPFASAPAMSGRMPARWNTPQQVSTWMHANGFAAEIPRQHGGFLLEITARDEWSAVERAYEQVERLAARVALATSSSLRPLDRAWVEGKPRPFVLRPEGRGIEVAALTRTNQLYEEKAPSRIDAALEMLADLKHGAAPRAVAGGWAGLEALLAGDGGEKAEAADRLGDLVACSFPRAELTTIAHAYQRHQSDALASDLTACGSNRERALRLLRELNTNPTLTTGTTSDDAALERLRVVLHDPRRGLLEVAGYARAALRRLYRQRNLVLHGGMTEAVALRSTLRTAAPLVGAGVDRLVHAWFDESVQPCALAARAAIQLNLLGTPQAADVVTLLKS